MHHTDPRELLVGAVKVLNKLKIQYLITGGIAVLVWGRPRFTADIDIVVEVQKTDVLRLASALRLLSKAGYLDQDAMNEAVITGGEFNFIDGETGVKIDFWVAKQNDFFDKERFKRKCAKTIRGQKVDFTSPEDLILIKLKWFAQSGSSKQMEDIVSIYKISGKKLDQNYIRKMTKRLKLEPSLRKFSDFI